MPIAAAKNHELHFRLRLLVAELDSFEYFVDHCLKRPRFLINIIENAIANGINCGHEQAQSEDCVDAVRQHPLYLIKDFGSSESTVPACDAISPSFLHRSSKQMGRPVKSPIAPCVVGHLKMR